MSRSVTLSCSQAALSIPITQCYSLLTDCHWKNELEAITSSTCSRFSDVKETLLSPLDQAINLSEGLTSFVCSRILTFFAELSSTSGSLQTYLGRINKLLDDARSSSSTKKSISLTVLLYDLSEISITICFSRLQRLLASSIVAPQIRTLQSQSYKNNDQKKHNTTAVLNAENGTVLSISSQSSHSSLDDETKEELESGEQVYYTSPPPTDFLTFWWILDSSVSIILVNDIKSSECQLPTRKLFEINDEEDLKINNKLILGLAALRDYILQYVYNIKTMESLIENNSFDILCRDIFVLNKTPIPYDVQLKAIQNVRNVIKDDTVWTRMQQQILPTSDTTLETLARYLYNWLLVQGSPLLNTNSSNNSMVVTTTPIINEILSYDSSIIQPRKVTATTINSTFRARSKAISGTSQYTTTKHELANSTSLSDPSFFKSKNWRRPTTTTILVSSGNLNSSNRYIQFEHETNDLDTLNQRELLERAETLVESLSASFYQPVEYTNYGSLDISAMHLKRNRAEIDKHHKIQTLIEIVSRLSITVGAATSAEEDNVETSQENLYKALSNASIKHEELLNRIDELQKRNEELYESEAIEAQRAASLATNIKKLEDTNKELSFALESITSERNALASAAACIVTNTDNINENVTLLSNGFHNRTQSTNFVGQCFDEETQTFMTDIMIDFETKLRVMETELQAAYESRNEIFLEKENILQQLIKLQAMYSKVENRCKNFERQNTIPIIDDTYDIPPSPQPLYTLRDELEDITKFSSPHTNQSLALNEISEVWHHVDMEMLGLQEEISAQQELIDNVPTLATIVALSLIQKTFNVLTGDRLETYTKNNTWDIAQTGFQLHHLLEALIQPLPNGWTVLHVALYLKDISFINFLNELIGSQNLKNCSRSNITTDLLFMLLDNLSLAASKPTHFGITPLHLAFLTCDFQTIRDICRLKGSFTVTDCKGNTPLHYIDFRKNSFSTDDLMMIISLVNTYLPNHIPLQRFCILFCNNKGESPKIGTYQSFHKKERRTFPGSRFSPCCDDKNLIQTKDNNEVSTSSLACNVVPPTKRKDVRYDDIPEKEIKAWVEGWHYEPSNCDPFIHCATRLFGDIPRPPRTNQMKNIEMSHMQSYTSSSNFLKKLLEQPIPSLPNNSIEISFDQFKKLYSPSLESSTVFQTIGLTSKEITTGIWSSDVINFTCNGIDDSYIPLTLQPQEAASHVHQILFLTCCRLILLSISSKENTDYKILFSTSLVNIQKIIVPDNSDSLCIICIYNASDYLLDISNRNDFLRLFCHYYFNEKNIVLKNQLAEDTNMDDTLFSSNERSKYFQKTTTTCRSIEFDNAKTSIISYKLDRILALLNGEGRRRLIIAFTEPEAFLILRYVKLSLLLQGPYIVHFGFVGVCLNPPACLADPLEKSEEIELTLRNPEAIGKTGIVWKEWFIILRLNGLIQFTLHPNESEPCFQISVNEIIQLRSFNYVTKPGISTSRKSSSSSLPCQPAWAIDFHPKTRPPSLIFHSYTLLDRSRWIEAIHFVRSQKYIHL